MDQIEILIQFDLFFIKEFFLLCATIILILSTVFTCIELIICEKIKGRIKKDEYIMK